jgi:predicted Zn-dependent protease
VHISQKHIVKELNIVSPESSPVLGFARLINASHDPARVAFTKVIDEAITILFERGYKKIDEIEADTMGVLLASSLGYDPTGLIRFLEKIKSIPGQEAASYKNLYPPIENRIKFIRQKIKKEGLSAETVRIRRKRLIDYKS